MPRVVSVQTEIDLLSTSFDINYSFSFCIEMKGRFREKREENPERVGINLKKKIDFTLNLCLDRMHVVFGISLIRVPSIFI